MKLKVKPEGREGVYLVEKSDLTNWIKDKDFVKIHNFVGGGFALIGADHDVDSVLSDIASAERLAILTGAAARGNMNHHLAVIRNNKLEMFDIGKITEEDLEISK